MRDEVSEKPSFLHCVLCSRASFARNRLGLEVPWNERDRKKCNFSRMKVLYIFTGFGGKKKMWEEVKMAGEERSGQTGVFQCS